MATRYLIAAMLLLQTPNALAWSEADTKRQMAYTALHIIDWGQTLDISDRCGERVTVTEFIDDSGTHITRTTRTREETEANPFLGTCPSRGEVNTYFLLSGVAHYAISRALPRPYREWWQYATITLEAGVVAHNFRAGIHVRF